MTSISDVLHLIYEHVPGDLGAQTLDTVKTGDPSQPVRGIVTCFMATHAILKQAAKLGANLVITHEPTFYNHLDDTEWLEGDSVYSSKQDLIARHGIVVWRFHDGIHRQKPDGIVEGVIQKLGWKADPARKNVYSIKPQTVERLAMECKERLEINTVRVVGDLKATCQRIGLLVGAYGGRAHIELFKTQGIDLLICGETQEWETCEYVRDANAMGESKALIVLGHANSEEAGMGHFSEWLRTVIPASIPLTHMKAGDPFQFI